jgi:hypothetical protein
LDDMRADTGRRFSARVHYNLRQGGARLKADGRLAGFKMEDL